MMFVEKFGVLFGEFKKEFFEGKDYEMKMVGYRYMFVVILVGEGVYVMISIGCESYLVYMLIFLEKLDQVQKEFGLKDKGSFIFSMKNFEYKGFVNV